MKKNTSLSILALAILDSVLNAMEQTQTQTTESATLPTTSTDNSPVMYGVSRSAFGEEDVVGFLVDEVGMELKSSSADYPPTAKMMAMSVDEVRQIMAYCDTLKKKAEFGDKVMKSVEMLKGLFK